MTARRLLGHLAQFSSLSKQGEVLCTQGLAFLLTNADARSVFAEWILRCTGFAVGQDAAWQAELRQEDGGRPDLEAVVDGKPIAKVEAKLGALLSKSQLKEYVADLHKRSGRGLLLVLVPSYRVGEATAVASSAFDLTGDGPWRLADWSDITVAVISWEDVLVVPKAVGSEPFAGDLDQFEAMYLALIGEDPGITNAPEGLAWRDREKIFVALVDRATRLLTSQARVYPMQTERDSESHGYRRRYVGCPLGADESFFSLGVRDPFPGYETPIWLRFHHDTPNFSVIRGRLEASSLSQRLVSAGRHIWIPLDVDERDGPTPVDSLVAQVKAVIEIACKPIR